MGDQGDVLAEICFQRVLDIDAVKEQGTLGGFVKAENKAGEGGLPCATGADESDYLPMGDFYIDVFQDRAAFVVGEGEVVKLDVAVKVLNGDRVFRIRHGVRLA